MCFNSKKSRSFPKMGIPSNHPFWAAPSNGQPQMQQKFASMKHGEILPAKKKK